MVDDKSGTELAQPWHTLKIKQDSPQFANIHGYFVLSIIRYHPPGTLPGDQEAPIHAVCVTTMTPASSTLTTPSLEMLAVRDTVRRAFGPLFFATLFLTKTKIIMLLYACVGQQKYV